MYRLYGLPLGTKHYAAFSAGVVASIVILIAGWGAWYMSPLIVVFLFLGILLYLLDFFAEIKRQKEIEIKFLEFVRSLVENVRSGVNVPQAIAQVKASGASFGALSPYLDKLANQLEWGYPLHTCLSVFAKDTRNPVIERSIGIVMQAEKSGGDMASVLEAVTQSVLQVKEVRDEMKSGAYNQIIQGYVIFFVFVGIMIILQVSLLPKLGDIGAEIGGSLGGGTAGIPREKADLGPVFILTIMIQGLFAGLMLGMFSEGRLRAGIIHAIAMVIVGFLIIQTATGLAGSGAVTNSTKTALLMFVPVGSLIKQRFNKKKLNIPK